MPDPFTLIIFGASGDLTERMLIPSLYHLFSENELPENFSVAGFSRKEMTNESFRENMKAGVIEHYGPDNFNEDIWKKFEKNLYYFIADYKDSGSYKKLLSEISHV